MCSCARAVFPSVLGVCKLVNEEATPVLYASLEARIDAPPTANFDHCELWSQCRPGLARATLITKMAFVASLTSIPIRISPGEDYTDTLKPLWTRLNGLPLSIKTFRLYLRLSCELDCEEFDYDEFLGPIALPKLRKLILEILCPSPTDDAMSEIDYAASFLQLLKQKAENKVKASNRTIEVVGVLREEGGATEKDLVDEIKTGDANGSADGGSR